MVAHIRPQVVFTAVLAAFSLATAACTGNDANTDGSDDASNSAPAVSQTAASNTTSATNAGPTSPLDFNADGQVVFGVAVTGPADAGGWSQSLVDGVADLSAVNGFATPVVSDRINPDDAIAKVSELADSKVDVIVLGSRALAQPLLDVIADHPDIYWYCNCGAGIDDAPNLAQVTDDGAEIGYTAGYATGLLLKEAGWRLATVVGCCDTSFEKQMYNSFEDGMQAVDGSLRMTYVRTGEPGFDFDNIGNATDAFRTAVDERTRAVLPLLDGAQLAVIEAAKAAQVMALSAGTTATCDDEAAYAIAVGFNAADYLRAVLPGLIDGTFTEGQTRVFKVGIDREPGARICGPTTEQQVAMDALYARIAAGELADQFAKVTEKAFANETASAEDLLD